MVGHFTGVGRRLSFGPLAAYRSPDVAGGPVDAVNGAFMLMRRRAIEEVGLFDEGYWMYMEDLDISYQLAQHDWLTWFDPTVTVIHAKAGTTGIRRPRLNWHFHYGMYRFYRKHYARSRSPVVNAAIYAGIVVKLGLSLTRNSVRRRISGPGPQRGPRLGPRGRG